MPQQLRDTESTGALILKPAVDSALASVTEPFSARQNAANDQIAGIQKERQKRPCTYWQRKEDLRGILVAMPHAHK